MAFLMSDVLGGVVDSKRVYVEYDSNYTDGMETMEGEITYVCWHEDEQYVEFQRDDGQVCVAHRDGRLVSKGSSYPVTGTISLLEVVDS